MKLLATTRNNSPLNPPQRQITKNYFSCLRIDIRLSCGLGSASDSAVLDDCNFQEIKQSCVSFHESHSLAEFTFFHRRKVQGAFQFFNKMSS